MFIDLTLSMGDSTQCIENNNLILVHFKDNIIHLHRKLYSNYQKFCHP